MEKLINGENTNLTQEEYLNQEFKVGDTIRSYDFPIIPGRKDRFVEGKFTGYHADGRIEIEVTSDSAQDAGGFSRVGEKVFTAPPGSLFFGEWIGRLYVTKKAEVVKIDSVSKKDAAVACLTELVQMTCTEHDDLIITAIKALAQGDHGKALEASLVGINDLTQ